MKKHIKKKVNFTKKYAWIAGGVVAAIVILIVVGFATGILPFVKNHADVKTFQLAHRFEITIQSDELQYDEENQCDNFVVNFSIKNIKDYGQTYDYDSNKPTADQITPEQEAQMSEEEKEEINKNTIYKHANKVAGTIGVNLSLGVYGIQDGNDMMAVDGERRDGTSSNSESLDKNIAAGENADSTLIFRLTDNGDCMVVFSAMVDPDDPKKDEFGGASHDQQEVHFSIAGWQSWGMRDQKNEENNEIKEKASVEKAEFTGVDVYLVDGWYVDTQASSAMKLKNQKFPKASIEVSYSSSENAQALATSTASWFKPTPEISKKQIGKNEFYYYQKSDNSFVLCADGKRGVGLRFSFDNLSLDDVQKLVEKLDFSL